MGDSGRDSSSRYTAEEREGVQTAREWRDRFEVEKHPADVYLSEVPLLERYRDPTKFEDPEMQPIDRKDTAKRRRDREIKQMNRELEKKATAGILGPQPHLRVRPLSRMWRIRSSSPPQLGLLPRRKVSQRTENPGQVHRH